MNEGKTREAMELETNTEIPKAEKVGVKLKSMCLPVSLNIC